MYLSISIFLDLRAVLQLTVQVHDPNTEMPCLQAILRNDLRWTKKASFACTKRKTCSFRARFQNDILLLIGVHVEIKLRHLI